MKRYVDEYATDIKLHMILLLNNNALSKERYLEMSNRIDTVISLCKRGMVTNREAVKEITLIFESLY